MPAGEPSWPEGPGKGGGSHVAFPLTPPLQPAGRGHAPSCQDPSHRPGPGSWVGLLPAVTSVHPRAGFLRVSRGGAATWPEDAHLQLFLDFVPSPPLTVPYFLHLGARPWEGRNESPGDSPVLSCGSWRSAGDPASAVSTEFRVWRSGLEARTTTSRCRSCVL